MPVRRADPAGWAGARSPTSEDGREGAVDSLEIDQREGLGVWRRSQRAIRSTDPGRSAWWVALRIIGAALGAITPFIIKLGTPWSIFGSLAGGLLSQAVISALQDWVSRRAKDRQAAESSEIYDSLVDKELEELKVHHSDRDASEFLPRDAQKKLIQNIEDRTPTLIIGPSMSGKTRLVVEAVRKNYPSTPVCFPKGCDDIQHLIDAPQGRRLESIIILDDIDRFISNQTLSLGQLNVWIREARIVIATMMKSRYIPWRDGVKDKLPGWDVVNRFTIIQMGALLTEHEKVTLLSSSYADLAADIEKVGLAPLLGGAPKVRQRLEEGREQHLWGYALVRAAADWRRAGLGPATKTQIQEVALTLKDDIAWGEPNWKKAWKWASEKTNDTVSLIRQTGSREWEVLDLVADEADWPLSQQTLEAMAGTEHSSRQAFAISLTMYMRGVLDDNKPVVKQILQEADEFLHKLTSKSTHNSDSFGLYAIFLTDVRHDHGRAQAMYDRAIDADPNHARNLGNYALFLKNVRRDYDQAQDMYERAIDADPNNARNLGNYAIFLTDFRHDHDRAQAMYERAIEANPNHANNLGNYSQLLFATGRDKTAIALVTRALPLAGTDEKPLVAECRFYLFAHSPEHRRESGENLRDLLAAGVTTGSWSFEPNLERLRREKDPRYDLVRDVADALSSGDTQTLESRGEWYAL